MFHLSQSQYFSTVHTTPLHMSHFFSLGFCSPLVLSPWRVHSSFVPWFLFSLPVLFFFCFSSLHLSVQGCFFLSGYCLGALNPGYFTVEMELTKQRGTVLIMSNFLMALRSNPKACSAFLRWRVFNADRVFRNLGVRLQQEFTNSVTTGHL